MTFKQIQHDSWRWKPSLVVTLLDFWCVTPYKNTYLLTKTVTLNAESVIREVYYTCSIVLNSSCTPDTKGRQPSTTTEARLGECWSVLVSGQWAPLRMNPAGNTVLPVIKADRNAAELSYGPQVIIRDRSGDPMLLILAKTLLCDLLWWESGN